MLQEVFSGASGMYTQALNSGDAVTSSVSVGGASADFHTTELSGVTIPATIHAGDAWTQSLTVEGTESINGTQIDAKNQTTNACTAIGVESVTVPAGTLNFSTSSRVKSSRSNVVST